MICRICLVDKKEKDFLLKDDFCYKCSYEMKVKLQKEKSKDKKLCRVCSKTITVCENIKKRQRNIFCSKECALIGHKDANNNHWTRQVRRNSKHF